MLLTLWINAFIPRDVAGYTRALTTGPNAGKTVVPLPGVARANPLNWAKDWDAGYLTDQRAFSSDRHASARMRSVANIRLRAMRHQVVVQPAGTAHETSGTVEVDMDTGQTLGRSNADLTACRFLPMVRRNRARHRTQGRLLFLRAPVMVNMAGRVEYEYLLSVRGAASDPLVSASADIDYDGTFVILPTRRVVFVDFVGSIDAFPAFEAYARLGNVTKTLFRSAPPAGNTVVDLLGGASRPVRGFTSFRLPTGVRPGRTP